LIIVIIKLYKYEYTINFITLELSINAYAAIENKYFKFCLWDDEIIPINKSIYGWDRDQTTRKSSKRIRPYSSHGILIDLSHIWNVLLCSVDADMCEHFRKPVANVRTRIQRRGLINQPYVRNASGKTSRNREKLMKIIVNDER
jgi:hypothetical protein